MPGLVAIAAVITFVTLFIISLTGDDVGEAHALTAVAPDATYTYIEDLSDAFVASAGRCRNWEHMGTGVYADEVVHSRDDTASSTFPVLGATAQQEQAEKPAEEIGSSLLAGGN